MNSSAERGGDRRSAADQHLELTLGWADADLTHPALRLRLHPLRQSDAHSSRNMVAIEIEVCLSAQFRTSLVCFGWDISEFCTQLERLHRSLAGRAIFRNQEESVQIEIVVVDPGRGRLAVNGDVMPPPLHPDAPVTHYAFTGLKLEQSWMPSIIEDMTRFLAVAAIDVEHPSEQ